MVLWIMGPITAGLTSFYMFRQVFMVFFGDYRGAHGGHHDDIHGSHGTHGHGHVVQHPHESPSLMTIPLVVLALGSVLVGFLNVPAALGGHEIFNHWLPPVVAAATPRSRTPPRRAQRRSFTRPSTSSRAP